MENLHKHRWNQTVTFLPPWPVEGDTEIQAMVPVGLDPGLGVFFIDLIVQAIDPMLDYDVNCNIARSGKVNDELLDTLF